MQKKVGLFPAIAAGLLLFSHPLLALDVTPPQYARDERPLFANETAPNWSPRIDAPGKQSDLLKIGAGAIPRGVQIDYQFLKSGNYIGIKREINLSDDAVALAFSVRSALPVTGIVLLEGSDGQFHRASFQIAGGEDQRIRLPLSKEGFPIFWKGDNNGNIRFPIRRLSVGVTPQNQNTGSLEFFDFGYVPRHDRDHAGCVVQLEPSKFDNVFYPDEQKVLLAHLRNQQSDPVEAKLQISLQSDNGTQSSFSKKVSLQPYEIQAVPVELPIRTPSFYELVLTVSVAGKKDALAKTSVAVVRAPALAEVPFENAFYGTSFGDNPATMRRIGARFIREIVHWKYTNPSDGSFSFEKQAEWGRRCREAGVGTIYTFAIWQRPDWLGSSDPGILKNEGPFNKWKSWLETGLHTLLVDPKTEAVEVSNEPDLEFSESILVKKEERIDLIAKLIRTGYDLVNSIDPGIPVLGAGCSGGGEGTLKLVKSILTKIDHKLDYVSIHPYPAGAQLMKTNGAWTWPDKYLAETVSPYEPLVSEFTNGKKIWCTELGWAYPTASSGIKGAALDYAAACAQTLVILKAMNHVGKVSWFIGTGLEPAGYGAATHAEAGYSYNFFKRSEFGKYEPTAAVSAFATVSSLLEEAQSEGNLTFGPAIEGYLFKNQATGRSIVALWASKRPVLFDFSERLPDTVVLDTLGRPNESKSIRLTRSPVFIVARQDQLNQLRQLVLSGKFVPEEPVAIEQIRSGSSNEVILDMISYADAPLDVKLTAGETTKEAKFQPGKNQIRLPLLPGSMSSDQLTLSLSLAVAQMPPKESVFTKRLVRARYSPETDLNSKEELTPAEEKLLTHELGKRSDILPMDPNIGWTGVDDLSARYGLWWNDKGLFLTVAARDDIQVPVPVGNTDFYQFDSLQFVIDPQCDSGDSLKAGDLEGGVALNSDGACENFQLFPITSGKPKFSAHAFRKGQVTVYRLFFPWSALSDKLLAGGSFIALNFILNDNDGNGRQYWMGLSDGIANGKRPSLYPWIYLESGK